MSKRHGKSLHIPMWEAETELIFDEKNPPQDLFNPVPGPTWEEQDKQKTKELQQSMIKDAILMRNEAKKNKKTRKKQRIALLRGYDIEKDSMGGKSTRSKRKRKRKCKRKRKRKTVKKIS